MSDILNAALKISDQSLTSRVGDETVLLNIENGTYFGLDAVGTYIWELLKEGLTPLAICARLVEDYGVSIETAETDARRFLTDLKERSIILAD